jgi:FG-GAP-like repeat
MQFFGRVVWTVSLALAACGGSDATPVDGVDAGAPAPTERAVLALPCIRALAVGQLNIDGPETMFISYSCTGGAIVADVVYDKAANSLSHLHDAGDFAYRFRQMFAVDVDGNPPLDVLALTQDVSEPTMVHFTRYGFSAGGWETVYLDMGVEDITRSDLDGDTSPDYVIAGSDSLKNVVVLGQGASTYTPLLEGRPFQRAVVAELNGDSQLDIAYLAAPAAGETEAAFGVALASNGGALSFQAEDAFTASAGGPMSLAAADLDQDGHADVLGTLSGVFFRSSKYGAIVHLDDPAKQVAIGDVDGDGHPDALLLSDDGLGVRRIFLEDSGSAVVLRSEPFVDANGDLLALADVDGDGVADVIVLSDQATAESRIRVFPYARR